MPEILNIEDFFPLIGHIPLIDVRSQSEYELGHIPEAINIPIFNNEERKQVGIRYKQSGKDFAIKLGMKLVEPKKEEFKSLAMKIAANNELLIHCWRGGMRSAKMSELFETTGIKTKLLFGGYTAYRRYIREQFSTTQKLMILGGFTGSGKTDIIKSLENKGEQILDLEEIAHHKGSAFGDIGQKQQPTNEQFENNLAGVLSKLDKGKRIWVEDESRTLGTNGIPETLYKIMRTAPVYKIDIPSEIRVQRLINEYAGLNREKLLNALNRIGKKLGNNHLKLAVLALQNNDFKTVAEISLVYYDKAYLKGISGRAKGTVNILNVNEDNPEKTVELLLEKFVSE